MKNNYNGLYGAIIILVIVSIILGIIIGMKIEKRIYSDRFITNSRRMEMVKKRFDANMELMQHELDSIYQK